MTPFRSDFDTFEPGQIGESKALLDDSHRLRWQWANTAQCRVRPQRPRQNSFIHEVLTRIQSRIHVYGTKYIHLMTADNFRLPDKSINDIVYIMHPCQRCHRAQQTTL
jgi:hypothetical protein